MSEGAEVGKVVGPGARLRPTSILWNELCSYGIEPVETLTILLKVVRFVQLQSEILCDMLYLFILLPHRRSVGAPVSTSMHQDRHITIYMRFNFGLQLSYYVFRSYPLTNIASSSGWTCGSTPSPRWPAPEPELGWQLRPPWRPRWPNLRQQNPLESLAVALQHLLCQRPPSPHLERRKYQLLRLSSLAAVEQQQSMTMVHRRRGPTPWGRRLGPRAESSRPLLLLLLLYWKHRRWGCGRHRPARECSAGP